MRDSTSFRLESALGLDKFVLWPVAEPAAWAQQIELIGREVASHYARAADAA